MSSDTSIFQDYLRTLGELFVIYGSPRVEDQSKCNELLQKLRYERGCIDKVDFEQLLSFFHLLNEFAKQFFTMDESYDVLKQQIIDSQEVAKVKNVSEEDKMNAFMDIQKYSIAIHQINRTRDFVFSCIKDFMRCLESNIHICKYVNKSLVGDNASFVSHLISFIIRYCKNSPENADYLSRLTPQTLKKAREIEESAVLNEFIQKVYEKND